MARWSAHKPLHIALIAGVLLAMVPVSPPSSKLEPAPGSAGEARPWDDWLQALGRVSSSFMGPVRFPSVDFGSLALDVVDAQSLPTEAAPAGTEHNAPYLFGGSTASGVQTYTGNFALSRPVVAIAGRGPSPALTLAYNSNDTRVGPLGPGWTHSYNVRVRNDGSGNALLVGAMGRSDKYTAPSWTLPPGVTTKLAGSMGSTWTATGSDQSVLNFDATGKLTSIVDRFGNTSTLTYNGSNQLTGVSDPAARGSLTFAYHATSGLLISVADWMTPTPRVVGFGYDASNRLSTITDREGKVTTYAYDGTTSRLRTVTDALSNVVVTNTFDAQGRVASQKDARGLTSGLATSFYYPAGSSGTTIVSSPPAVYDPTWNVLVEDTHDSSGLLTQRIGKAKSTGANGEWTYLNKTYDSSSFLSTTSDNAGNTTRYCYDIDYAGASTLGQTSHRGNLSRVIGPSPTGGAARPVTLSKYDSKNNVIQTYSPNGVSSTSTTDCTTNLSASLDADYAVDSAYDTTTQTKLESVTRRFTDPDLGLKTAVTKSEYTDAANPGLVTKVIPPLGNTGGAPDYTYATTYAYFTSGANAGLLQSVTDPLGNVTTYGYDSIARKITTVDALGNASGGTPAHHTWSTLYDKEDRVLLSSSPAPTGGGSPLESETIYDAVGNRTVTIDANGQVTKYVYDERNLLEETHTSPSVWWNPVDVPTPLYITQRQYGHLGELTRVIRALGDSATERGSDVQSDGLGRVRKLTHYPSWPNLDFPMTYTSTYDANSNRVQTTNPAGLATSYAYDNRNRLTSVTYADGGVTPTVAFTYDANNNRLTRGVAWDAFTYDELNRMTSSNGVAYRYDLDGRRRHLTYPGQNVDYEYDKAGRLSSVKDFQNRVTSYAYDPDGALKTTTNFNGTSAVHAYDNARRQTEVWNKFGASLTFSKHTYTLDNVGNRTQVVDVLPRLGVPVASLIDENELDELLVAERDPFEPAEVRAAALPDVPTTAPLSGDREPSRGDPSTPVTSGADAPLVGQGVPTPPSPTTTPASPTTAPRTPTLASPTAAPLTPVPGSPTAASPTPSPASPSPPAATPTTGPILPTAPAGGAPPTATTSREADDTNRVYADPDEPAELAAVPPTGGKPIYLAGKPGPALPLADQRGNAAATHQYGLASAGYRTDLFEKGRSAANVRLTHTESGATLGFELAGAAGAPEVREGGASARLGALTVTWTAYADRLKEEIVLDSRPAGDRIQFTVAHPGLTLTQDAAGGYFVKDSGDRVRYYVAAPTVWDARGQPGAATLDMRETAATITLDAAFLARATYPVTVDPTVFLILGTADAMSVAFTSSSRLVRDAAGALFLLYQQGAAKVAMPGTHRNVYDSYPWTTGPAGATGVTNPSWELTPDANGLDMVCECDGAIKYGRWKLDRSNPTYPFFIAPASLVTLASSGERPSLVMDKNGKPAVAWIYRTGNSWAVRFLRAKGEPNVASSWVNAEGTSTTPDELGARTANAGPGTLSLARMPSGITPTSNDDALYLFWADHTGNMLRWSRARTAELNYTAWSAVSDKGAIPSGADFSNALTTAPDPHLRGIVVGYSQNAAGRFQIIRKLAANDSDASDDTLVAGSAWPAAGATDLNLAVDRGDVYLAYNAGGNLETRAYLTESGLGAATVIDATASSVTMRRSASDGAVDVVYVREVSGTINLYWAPALTKRTRVRQVSVTNGSFIPTLPTSDTLSKTTIGYTVTDDVSGTATVNVKVYTGGGTLVRTVVNNVSETLAAAQWGYSTTFAKEWDGKNDGGTVQPAGRYTVKINATDGTYAAPDQVITTDILGGQTVTLTYEYDRLYRLISANNIGTIDGITDYTYDAVHNRTSMTRSGVTTTYYRYDRADRIDSAGATDYVLDINGNAMARGTTTFTFNQANQMTALRIGGVGPLYYYDADGTRHRTTNEFHDETSPLRELLSVGYPSATAWFVYGHGLASSWSSTYGHEVLHTDGLGSVRASSHYSGSGAVNKTTRTDEFGNVITKEGGPPLTYYYDFAQQERDNESGLMYMRARMYDPVVGRFLQREPLTVTAKVTPSNNDYVYVDNNPLRFIDPTGLFKVDLYYTPANTLGLPSGQHHAYIIVTDLDGSQMQYRAGPGEGEWSRFLTARAQPHQGGGPPNQSREWGNPTADYRTIIPDDGITPAAEANRVLTDFVRNVNTTMITYQFRHSNSNAFAHQAIEVLTGTRPRPPANLPSVGWDFEMRVERQYGPFRESDRSR